MKLGWVMFSHYSILACSDLWFRESKPSNLIPPNNSQHLPIPFAQPSRVTRLEVWLPQREALRDPCCCWSLAARHASQLTAEKSVLSMGWLNGKITWTPNIEWENRWFPVGFPLNHNSVMLRLTIQHLETLSCDTCGLASTHKNSLVKLV